MISEAQKTYYAELWVLKMLDLSPDEGGLEFAVASSGAWAALEPVLEGLAVQGLLEIDRKRGLYGLTPVGLDRIGNAIDEAEAFIEEFDEQEAADVVREVRRRNLDALRVRFLWGWYQGEFDDLTLFQQRRGSETVEHEPAEYLLSDAFYEELSRELS